MLKSTGFVKKKRKEGSKRMGNLWQKFFFKKKVEKKIFSGMSLTKKKKRNHFFISSFLLQFLSRELADSGYAGVEVRTSPTQTEIVIRATRTKV